ncbi:MAG: hypothetical protein IJE23_01670 [Tyzzerella sp.]|nr:hypothetical protein [Tyzzerella sp.]
MIKYDIEFYSKQNGEEPAREFILKIDEKMQAKILRIIDLLEANGPQLRLPYSESLKKTAKTPRREIELAKKYREDYERRLCDE